MPKFLVRIVAFILVSCLIADPALAVACHDPLSHQWWESVKGEGGLFASQALAPGQVAARGGTPAEPTEIDVLRLESQQVLSAALAKPVPLVKGLVLLVEDTPEEQKDYKKELETRGYEAILCPNGETALDYLTNARETGRRLPGVILTDRYLGHGKLRGQMLAWNIRREGFTMPIFVQTKDDEYVGHAVELPDSPPLIMRAKSDRFNTYREIDELLNPQLLGTLAAPAGTAHGNDPWPNELTLSLPGDHSMTFELTPQGDNRYFYSSLGDHPSAFMFTAHDDHISWMTVNVDEHAPDGVATAIGRWLLEQSVHRGSTNPMSLTLDLVDSPHALGIADKLFRHGTIQVYIGVHGAPLQGWVPIDQVDVYGLYGPLKILPSGLSLEEHYKSNQIRVVKKGPDYEVLQKPEEVEVTFKGPLMTVIDRATGQRLPNINFNHVGMRLRIRGATRIEPAAPTDPKAEYLNAREQGRYADAVNIALEHLKVSDIPSIYGRPREIVSENVIDQIVDPALVEACKILYRKGIPTYSSSATIAEAKLFGRAWIALGPQTIPGEGNYGTYLSAENIEVFKQLQEAGYLVPYPHRPGLLTLVFPVDLTTSVKALHDLACNVANRFTDQRSAEMMKPVLTLPLRSVTPWKDKQHPASTLMHDLDNTVARIEAGVVDGKSQGLSGLITNVITLATLGIDPGCAAAVIHIVELLFHFRNVEVKRPRRFAEAEDSTAMAGDAALLRLDNPNFGELFTTVVNQASASAGRNPSLANELLASLRSLKVIHEERPLNSPSVSQTLQDNIARLEKITAVAPAKPGKPLAIAPKTWWGRLYHAVLNGPDTFENWKRQHDYWIKCRANFDVQAWARACNGELDYFERYLERTYIPTLEFREYLNGRCAALCDALRALTPGTPLDRKWLKGIIWLGIERTVNAHDTFFIKGFLDPFTKEEAPDEHRELVQAIRSLGEALIDRLAGLPYTPGVTERLVFAAFNAYTADHRDFNDSRDFEQGMMVAGELGEGTPPAAPADRSLRNSAGQSLKDVLGAISPHLWESPIEFWSASNQDWQKIGLRDFLKKFFNRQEIPVRPEMNDYAVQVSRMDNEALQREVEPYLKDEMVGSGPRTLRVFLDELSRRSDSTLGLPFLHYFRSIAFHLSGEQRGAHYKKMLRWEVLLHEILYRWGQEIQAGTPPVGPAASADRVSKIPSALQTSPASESLGQKLRKFRILRLLSRYYRRAREVSILSSELLASKALSAQLTGCAAIIGLGERGGLAHVAPRSYLYEEFDRSTFHITIEKIAADLTTGKCLIIPSVLMESVEKAARLTEALATLGVSDVEIVDPFQWGLPEVISGMPSLCIKAYVTLMPDRSIEIWFARLEALRHYGTAVYERGVWRYDTSFPEGRAA